MIKNEILTLCTFNCRGLGEGRKRRMVLSWLQRYHSGIIFLQETHSTVSSEGCWVKNWNGQIYFNHGTSSARGVVTLITKDVDIIINNIVKDDGGRFILLDSTFEGQSLILANIYAPTKDKRDIQIEFLQYINEQIAKVADKNLLLGGDFNICLEPLLDKKRGDYRNEVKKCRIFRIHDGKL